MQSALKHVPDNSVVIEIAPHALLQAILKPSVGSKCTHVGLVRRNHSTVSNLLSSIGNLFNAGLQPKIENLYPPISYPVSRGTPSLQPLVEWDHSDDWDVITFIENEVASSGEVQLDMDVDSEIYEHLRGTYIDGVEVLPYASYLVSSMQRNTYILYFGVETYNWKINTSFCDAMEKKHIFIFNQIRIKNMHLYNILLIL